MTRSAPQDRILDKKHHTDCAHTAQRRAISARWRVEYELRRILLNASTARWVTNPHLPVRVLVPPHSEDACPRMFAIFTPECPVIGELGAVKHRLRRRVSSSNRATLRLYRAMAMVLQGARRILMRREYDGGLILDPICSTLTCVDVPI